MLVVLGGIIPDADLPALKAMGVAAVPDRAPPCRTSSISSPHGLGRGPDSGVVSDAKAGHLRPIKHTTGLIVDGA